MWKIMENVAVLEGKREKCGESFEERARERGNRIIFAEKSDFCKVSGVENAFAVKSFMWMKCDFEDNKDRECILQLSKVLNDQLYVTINFM
jgi:hypothetical protein